MRGGVEMMKKVPFYFFMDSDLKQKMVEHAAETGRTLTGMLTVLLKKYMKEVEEKRNDI